MKNSINSKEINNTHNNPEEVVGRDSEKYIFESPFLTPNHRLTQNRLLSRILFGCLIAFAILFMIGVKLPSYVAFYTDCRNAENDASMVLDALAEYFSDPEKSIIPAVTVLQNAQHFVTINPINNITISPAPDNRIDITPMNIQVTVKDASERCRRGTAFTKAIGGGRGVWK